MLVRSLEDDGIQEAERGRALWSIVCQNKRFPGIRLTSCKDIPERQGLNSYPGAMVNRISAVASPGP